MSIYFIMHNFKRSSGNGLSAFVSPVRDRIIGIHTPDLTITAVCAVRQTLWSPGSCVFGIPCTSYVTDIALFVATRMTPSFYNG
jgi:hypothetical protein